ncbi:1-phosphofructokinase [Microbacterium ulmi]|uniref:1-phosphofructokinase n=1 Tax=Microbacterium ulmi TaxID=179095 RepID=A0A7Y2PZT3_9MICO|nr:1-phosphofructokinase [Microbacterium ulmi]NII71273.1 1-phosphofructokinase [Microbacterium ulmi]NNH02577.1 1-phosphofructokinase [Microbacterium ulmi]
MIVTLTANPALDRTITLEAPLRPGDVQAAVSAREDAGGKGINVSRVVAAAGVDTIAVLPLADDDPFDAALRASGVVARRVPIAGHVRENVTITDPAGVTTKLNLPGVALGEADVAAIVDTVVAASEGARWLVLAGSLPPGAGDSFYVQVIEAVRDAYGDAAPRIAVDASGAALAAVVASGRPDLIKPNDEELAELADVALDDARDLPRTVLDIARRLVPSSVGAALVTLGAHGAVLVDGDGAWTAVPPRIRVASTVGAGDSSLAGYLLAAAEGEGPEERLRRAIRYGAAAASLPGTQAPSPRDLPDGAIAIAGLS